MNSFTQSGNSNDLKIRIKKKLFSTNGKIHLIFQNFELDISSGEFLCILGPSGCGKSTLLRMISGLDQDYDGEICIDGNPISGPGRDRSLVFQRALLLPWMTVSQNIEFALDRAYSNVQRRSMIKNSLELVELDHASELNTYHLSGGMVTRAALARAIADPPKTLLLDEPFNALDFYTQEAIHNNIVRIQDQHNFTTLMVTHDLDEAIYLSDRVIVLTDPPVSIAEDINVVLERPRSRNNPEFQGLLTRLLDAMREARRIRYSNNTV